MTARQVETNVTRSTVTGSVGQYFLPNLPSGRYEINCELSGFTAAKRTDVVLIVGQEATLDFVLRIAGVAENVTVTGQAALLETQHTLGEVIGNKLIDDLPTVSRDFNSSR